MNSLEVFYSYSTSIVYSLGKCRISIEVHTNSVRKDVFEDTRAKMTEIV